MDFSVVCTGTFAELYSQAVTGATIHLGEGSSAFVGAGTMGLYFREGANFCYAEGDLTVTTDIGCCVDCDFLVVCGLHLYVVRGTEFFRIHNFTGHEYSLGVHEFDTIQSLPSETGPTPNCLCVERNGMLFHIDDMGTEHAIRNDLGTFLGIGASGQYFLHKSKVDSSDDELLLLTHGGVVRSLGEIGHYSFLDIGRNGVYLQNGGTIFFRSDDGFDLMLGGMPSFDACYLGVGSLGLYFNEGQYYSLVVVK